MPKAVATTKVGPLTREGLLSSPWPGFTVPRYTQVPDEVFDVLMPILTEAEFKCLCYICRRTFGFRKDADAISLNQMCEGIRTRDGKVIDRGTGMSKPSVAKALSFLVNAGVVHVQKRISEAGEYETNVYSLHVLPPGQTKPTAQAKPEPTAPVVKNINHRGKKSFPGVGNIITHRRPKSLPPVGENVNTQETEVRNTVNNNTNVVADVYETKIGLCSSLTDLGVRKSVASRLISEYGDDHVSRVLQYALYRLSKGWRPRESLPAWLVGAITQGWEIPSWFKTAEESTAERAALTAAQQRQLRQLEEERQQEEIQMAKQRARTLRSLGIRKGTDLLWAKVNQWLQERGLWRPALTTAALASVTEQRAVVLCGYAFSLEMVKRSANAIRDALAALTGRVVKIEVRPEQRLFASAQ